MDQEGINVDPPRSYRIKPERKSDFQVILTQPHFHGGEKLTGLVELNCDKREELRAMFVGVEAVYEIPYHGIKRVYDHTDLFPIYSKNCQVLSYPIALTVGVHKLEFTADLLPQKGPPTGRNDLTSDRRIIYNCKIELFLGSIPRRVLQSECEFEYSPQHRVLDYDASHQVLVEKQFIDCLLKTSASKAMKLFKRSGQLGSKFPINVCFGCPRYGLRQDIPNSFDLRIKSPSSDPLIINLITIDLEPFVKIASKTGIVTKSKRDVASKTCDVTRSKQYTLFEAKDITISEKSNPLSSMLQTVILPRVLPTHEVHGLHSQFYKLHIRLSITQKSDDGEREGDVKRTFTVAVLSPYVTVPGVHQQPINNDLYNDNSTPPPCYDKQDEATSNALDGSELPSYDEENPV